MDSHILLIDCKDKPGLVSQITGVLYSHDCNIIENHEFVEEETGRFFMRTEFSGDIHDTIITRELYTVLPERVSITLTRNAQKKIVIMATKEHHCLGELLIRFYFGELNARILAVISNHENLKELVDKFEIPYHYITHNNMWLRSHHIFERMRKNT